MGEMAKLITQLGLGAALALFIAWLLRETFKWGKTLIEDTLRKAEEREKKLLVIIEGHSTALTAHTQHAQQFGNDMKTAFQYNRDEHKQQTKVLDEQTKVLGRINGYKKGDE